MTTDTASSSVVQVKDWGNDIKEYKLTGGDIEVRIYNLGGIIQSIRVPNSSGEVADVTLGYDTPQEYGNFYFGALIGRFANRIANGKFTLDGVEHRLAVNNGPNHLHGGISGFDKKVWGSRIKGSQLELSYTSADNEESYPGQLDVKVVYEVTEENELIIDYTATCDKPTILNLTNHAYFNLQGHDKGDIYSHAIEMASDYFTPKNDANIPNGEIAPVDSTTLDLRHSTVLTEERLNATENPGFQGFDHNYVVRRKIDQDSEKVFVGRVVAGGRGMDTYTTQPGVQLYTGYFINCEAGKSGAKYGKYSGLCLETQNYPDAPNKPNFPSAVLRPGEIYHQTTWYKFFTTA